jgi:GT2 family glycosyltransferase
MALPLSTNITAIIVTRDSEHVLSACLKSARDAGLHIVVVDNASQDGSRAMAHAAGAEVIANDRNQGYGRAINQALTAGTSPFCLILNADIAFEPHAPVELLRLLEADPSAAMIAPRLIEPDGRRFELTDSPINPPLTETSAAGAQRRPLLSGAALLARRDKLLAIGGFDPNIFLFWEDNDLCRRLIDAGDTLLLAEAVSMRHKRGASSAPTPGAIYMRRWHQAWSRFYVFQKFGVSSDPDKWIAAYSRKAMLAGLFGKQERKERYRGSLEGALAFRDRETALARQGLV